MKKKTRILVFYLLIAIFAAGSPLLIIYSLGYHINLSNIRVEKTGGIFVKSKIPMISLFLDGTFQKETSFFSGGALLTEIKPGTHILRIEKQNHQPWFKTVTIEPMIVTELRNIILLPNVNTTQATSSPDELPQEKTTTLPKRNIRIDKKNNLIEEKENGSTTIATSVNSFSVFGNTLFWVNKNGFLARQMNENAEIESLGRPGFYLNKKPIRFIDTPRGETMLIDSSGGLFLLDDTRQLMPIDGGVIDVRFDSKGEKALIIKERELALLWLSANRYQPFQKKHERETLFVINEVIKDARWYYGDNAHMVFHTNEGIFFTEIDGRGGRNTMELISNRADDLLTFPDSPNTIFFRQKNTIYKIEI